MIFRTALEQYLSPEQLSVLGSVKIGIAGAGGLGSNCSVCLVRSGFRRFRIIDYDCVEPGNLNRQFFFPDQIGMPKVDALAQTLRRIEPDLELELIRQKITAEDAGGWFQDCDVVLECVDVAATKALLVEQYAPTGKLVVAVSGIAGWGESDRLRVRNRGGNLYLIGDETSGVDRLPPLAPLVTAAAAKQADIVLAHILDRLEDKKGRGR
ncbi:Hypothetical protein LUCI_1136 [Lucifera butyrica]|uniref:THIF-type NAD/FAD binding fold domain-containing protein n=2 Tax=Lucifera butyrica TaxID=1351585 RepID=A0A498R465_9FIRM|nr:Hypothetical protein LUCI_1136 [Lucifera butyrica]